MKEKTKRAIIIATLAGTFVGMGIYFIVSNKKKPLSNNIPLESSTSWEKTDFGFGESFLFT